MVMLTEDIREFLAQPLFAVVATIRSDGFPHQTVMWFALREDKLLLNTPYDSLKHRHLKQDARVSVCVEAGYQYVTLNGVVTLDENPETAGADYAQLGQRYRETFAQRPAFSASGERPAILRRERVTLWVTIDSILKNGF